MINTTVLVITHTAAKCPLISHNIIIMHYFVFTAAGYMKHLTIYSHVPIYYAAAIFASINSYQAFLPTPESLESN